jgi:hypothetical protein
VIFIVDRLMRNSKSDIFCFTCFPDMITSVLSILYFAFTVAILSFSLLYTLNGHSNVFVSVLAAMECDTVLKCVFL